MARTRLSTIGDSMSSSWMMMSFLRILIAQTSSVPFLSAIMTFKQKQKLILYCGKFTLSLTSRQTSRKVYNERETFVINRSTLQQLFFRTNLSKRSSSQQHQKVKVLSSYHIFSFHVVGNQRILSAYFWLNLGSILNIGNMKLNYF